MRTNICKRCIALLVLLVVGCESPDRTSEQAADSVTPVRVGYLPIAECAHLYIAISNGYFQEEGLEVQLQPMRGGATILPALQQEDLDVGFSNLVSMVMLNSRLRVASDDWLLSLAGGTYERSGHTNHALLTRKEDDVTLEDIGSGRARVALNTTRNIEELMLREYLALNNVQQERMEIVQMAFPEMVPALLRRDVDVVSVVEPFINPPLQQGRVRKIAEQYQAVDETVAVATYAITRQWLRDNGETARAFRRAIRAADNFIKGNELATRRVIGTFTRIREEDLPIIGLPAFEPDVSIKDLEALSRGMVEFQFISAPPQLNQMVYEE